MGAQRNGVRAGSDRGMCCFPFGDHDDLVDSMTQAVMRFRQGGFLEHPEDAPDEPLPQKQRTYY